MEEITIGVLAQKTAVIGVVISIVMHIVAIKTARRVRPKNEFGTSMDLRKMLCYFGPSVSLMFIFLGFAIYLAGQFHEVGAIMYWIMAIIPYFFLSFFAFRAAHKKVIIEDDYLVIVKVFSKRKVSYSKIKKMVVNKQSGGIVSLIGVENLKLIRIKILMPVENYPILLKKIEKHDIPVVTIEPKEGRTQEMKDIEDNSTRLD